jgi:polysaccharide export outer membrane protein
MDFSTISAVNYRGILTMLRKAIFFIGLVLLAACASDLPSVNTLAEYEQANPLTSKSEDDYLIGPGDVVSIDIWKEPELSKQVTVRLDGNISMPLVGDLQAAGFTCTELRDQLTEKYKGYVEVAEVSVTLVQSLSKKIYILGKINSPGEYPLQKNMTILQAISLGGGLDQWADTSNIRLIRKIKGVEKTFKVDYDAIVSGEDLSQNVQLQPDDTIFVP